jgi:hypothetical protein
LVQNGIPFDVAFALDDIKRLAFYVICKEEKERIKFNFHTLRFEEVSR